MILFWKFFENFEKSLLPEIKKTDVYFYTIKAVTQTQFEACVNAIFNFWVNFSNIVDSRYVTSSQCLRKGFSQKLGITYKGDNASYKLSLCYRLYSVKVNISFPNFWEKTLLKVLKKSFKTRLYSSNHDFWCFCRKSINFD